MRNRGPILVYGEAGSGKTNLALYIAALNSSSAKKILYVNTEGWSIKARIIDLSKYWDLGNIDFVDIISFRQQTLFVLRRLPRIIDRYNIVIIDTINNLYRVEEDIDAATRSLSTQMAMLYSFATDYLKNVFVLGQVKAEDEGEEVSGSTYIKYWSTIIMRLERGKPRRIVVERPERMELFFEINERGIRWVEAH